MQDYLPYRSNLLGVMISRTSYEETANIVIEHAKTRSPMVVSALAVHAVVTGAVDEDHKKKLNDFEILAPDGQPVRWALNLLGSPKLHDRVYGPDLMLRVCEKAVSENITVYFYGSHDHVLHKMTGRLKKRIPGLKIAGVYSPRFEPSTPQEDIEDIKRVNDSGAGIVFVGLGCPRQDIWAFAHKNKLNAVIICVGAAFDFHAGTKKQAPVWMQRCGLEWFYRLTQEPKRLWKRYLKTNSAFIILFALQLLGLKKFGCNTS